MVLSPWHKRAFHRMYCRNIRPRVLALVHNCLVGGVDGGRERIRQWGLVLQLRGERIEGRAKGL